MEQELLFAPHPVVVYDLEFTSWPGAHARNWSGPGEHREVVQIGAVLLDGNRDEVASHSQLVRPTVNPVLSDYFVELTGITNEDVASHGVPLSQALQAFAGFCAEARLVCSFGPDHEVIQESCALTGLHNPMAHVRFLNVRDYLCEAAGVRPFEVYSSNLPLRFGLPLQAQAHDGVSDARAIASVLRHLRSRASGGSGESRR